MGFVKKLERNVAAGAASFLMAVAVLSITGWGVALGEVTLSTPESAPPSVYITQNPDET